jgi:hypothetical protein
MLSKEPPLPIIDEIFDKLMRGQSPVGVDRYLRVRDRLMLFFETADMTEALGAERAALLQYQRDYRDIGAFWSMFGAAELIECLPLYISDKWRMRGAGDALTQLLVVSRILDAASGMCGSSADLDKIVEVRHAMARARMEIRLPDQRSTFRPSAYRPPTTQPNSARGRNTP